MSRDEQPEIALDAPEAYFDRELSWLGFARRVLAQVEDPDLPLLERVKFAGIMGMLHDEFFMKRMSGIKRRIRKGAGTRALGGRSPEQQLEECRAEIGEQVGVLSRVMREQIVPALARVGLPILDYEALEEGERAQLREYFRGSVQPILTPLAVDTEHPFPFISNDALNLGVVSPPDKRGQTRFIRIKVPNNRPRWVPLASGRGFVPLEQVIAANLDLMVPLGEECEVYFFRVTRGAQGEVDSGVDLSEEELAEPGSIVRQVSAELKARRFAGVVRMQVSSNAPPEFLEWIGGQLGIGSPDIYPTDTYLRIASLLDLDTKGRDELRLPRHEPVTHPRLRSLAPGDTDAIFREIDRGDILLHHPFDSFDSSVLRFIESAAVDPSVLAIKLTIYRTSKGSPIVQALAEASRRGKQVAVLVEITARFDEAPNIAWGQYLEAEGVHVSYGVEKLKTHVKLVLVVREEGGRIRRYAHVGTGNYHTGTARIYEDVGLLTCDPEICEDVSAVFNQLTGAAPVPFFRRMLVAPATMRSSFVELIRREAQHARAGLRCGIRAKMNQLQDPEIIRELYAAGRAGVPIELNIRGLCCLRPGVPGLSENIRVFSVIGRFLEHSRIYRFENDGDPIHLLGSADWMHRNLTNRVETIMPVLSEPVKLELDHILDVYTRDNTSAWDARPDGTYVRRRPSEGERLRAAQDVFIEERIGRMADAEAEPTGPVTSDAAPEALPLPIDEL